MSRGTDVTRTGLPAARRGAGSRAALALVGALAVLGGAAGASSPDPLGLVGVGHAQAVPGDATVSEGTAPEGTAPEGTVSGGTVITVDPAACGGTSGAATGGPVVCRPADAAALASDGATVVLAAGEHEGPLDLRGLTGVTVRGEAGAVLDAAGARYALSARDVTDITVESLTLRGGTAQTVWLERAQGAHLRDLTVTGSEGSGVQVRDTSGLRLSDSAVTGAASAGVMELTGVRDSSYERLVVTDNGHGPAEYNGDGLQLAGVGVRVTDVVTSGNGSAALYEHGIYVAAAARDVALQGITAAGNAGVAVKLGGSGTLERSALADDRLALYCGTTAEGGWTVRATTLDAPQASAGGTGCVLEG